jgi:hypothetical protein
MHDPDIGAVSGTSNLAFQYKLKRILALVHHLMMTLSVGAGDPPGWPRARVRLKIWSG